MCQAIDHVAGGRFEDGTIAVFDVKNGGLDVGRINSSVPKKFVGLMNDYRQRIVGAPLRVPSL